jgi:hypothetical protein
VHRHQIHEELEWVTAACFFIEYIHSAGFDELYNDTLCNLFEFEA